MYCLTCMDVEGLNKGVSTLGLIAVLAHDANLWYFLHRLSQNIPSSNVSVAAGALVLTAVKVPVHVE